MKRVLRKTSTFLYVEFESGFSTHNMSAENIFVEITNEKILRFNFDCSRSRNLDSYDFERAEEDCSQIISLDFHDDYLKKQLENFLWLNRDNIKIEKVLVNIRFVTYHLNELKFGKFSTSLIK